MKKLTLFFMIFFIISSFAYAEINTSNIVIQYGNQSSGTTWIDLSKNQNSTLYGGASLNGWNLSLDGGNDYAEGSINVDFSQDFSHSFWILNEAYSKYLFDITIDSNNFIRLVMQNAASDMYVYYNGQGSASSGTLTGFNSFADGVYHNVIMTYDVSDNELQFFKDGVLNNTHSFSNDLSGSSATITWGANGAHTNLMLGLLSNVIVFDKELDSSDISDIQSNGRTYDYFKVISPNDVDSVESTAVVKQEGSVLLTGPAAETIVSSNFDVDINNTSLYGGYSIEVISSLDNELYCELLIDSVVYANVTRDNTAGDIGNAFIMTGFVNLTNGTHTQDLVCQRSVGPGQITISDSVGIGHFMLDELNRVINHDEIIINEDVTSGSSFTQIGAINFTIGNLSSGERLHSLVIESTFEFINNDASDEVLDAYMTIDDFNCSKYKRFVGAGNIGSVSMDCALEDVNASQTYEVKVFANGTDAHYNGKVLLKDFFLSDEEIAGGVGALVGAVFNGSTDTMLFNLTGGNINHANSNVFEKMSLSILTDIDTQVDVYIKLRNGITRTTKNFTRDFQAGEIGVLIGHDSFINIPEDNYTIEVWANCGGANCEIVGGAGIGYITDVTTTIINAFEIRAFDNIDNSGIMYFNATDGLTFTTTTGNITYFTTNTLETFTISSSNYQNITYTNYNTSNDLNVTMNRSYLINDVEYSNYINVSGTLFVNSLNYSINYNCRNDNMSIVRYINGAPDGVVSGLVCDGTNNVVEESFTRFVEGSYDISFYLNHSLNASFFNYFIGNETFFSDITAPVAEVSFNLTQGFTLNRTFTPTLTCYDNYPVITYNLSYAGNVVLYGNYSNGSTQGNSTDIVSGNQFLFGQCSDLFQTGTDISTITAFSKTFLLWDEILDTAFDVNNITNVRMWFNDNSTFYDFQAEGTTNVTALGINETKIRLELEYDTGDIITRYLDITLIPEEEPKVCANREGIAHFEQISLASSLKPILVQNIFSKCYVAADYTRFAFQTSKILPFFTINSNYLLNTIDSAGNLILLASLDGSIQSEINVDSLEFINKGFNFDILRETLTYEQVGNSTLLMNYANIQNDSIASNIIISRLDTGEVLFDQTITINPNFITLYFDYSTFNVSSQTVFKVVVTGLKSDNSESELIQYFNLSGESGILSAGIAMLIVVFLTVFGLTFLSVKSTFSWFGLFLMIGNIIILSVANKTWYTLLMMVFQVIFLVYIGIIMFTKNPDQVA